MAINFVAATGMHFATESAGLSVYKVVTNEVVSMKNCTALKFLLLSFMLLFFGNSFAFAAAEGGEGALACGEEWKITVHMVCKEKRWGIWVTTVDKDISSVDPHPSFAPYSSDEELAEMQDEFFDEAKKNGEANNNDKLECTLTLVKWEYIGPLDGTCMSEGDGYQDNGFFDQIADEIPGKGETKEDYDAALGK